MGGRDGHRLLLSAIPHDKLMDAVEERVCDQSVLKLLRGMLRVGVMQDGQILRTSAGTPQGGVFSPAMCNVYLRLAGPGMG